MTIFNTRSLFALALASSCTLSTSVMASQSEQDWGIAAMYRIATVPYSTPVGDQTVSTFVPMMYFNNDYVFVDGVEGGLHLANWQDEKFELNALTRIRFVDLPASIQNANQGDTADVGFQLRYQLNDTWHFDWELMSDEDTRLHTNLRATAEYDFGDWELKPHATLRYKDADFNSRYYAFDKYTGDKIGAGMDVNVGIDARYHVTSNLYLLGSTSVTSLDNNAYSAAAVTDRFEGEVFVGFGFFPDKTKARKTELTNKRYLRIAHGWATPSNIGDIFALNREKDPYNNQMTSVFYGHPLTDELFGLPVDLYFTPGIAHHWDSKVQGASTEYIAAIKAYVNFDWPTRWRFGFAEGLSYIDNITYVEASEMAEKGYTPSHLLNYLDFSLDVNVGDLVNDSDWKNVWVGYSLHHRSAIFEKASQFGRIKGGSNYNTVYVQFNF
ncbi:MltA-interacting MipA family protein [Vibrio ponticus]|uniref:MltA-interacting MipA family protein n=1 Tax=Vibrio ponticus TaxID=265668 RepID=A0ABX3F9T3_9VIBR|nr:MipA/OmpV family protein [Vibrio ponticus]OLQ87748.1 MltA-interacting MipA family protein [Vibrio ponticus]